MTRALVALLLGAALAGTAGTAGAQATPATARAIKERAQRTADAASARSRDVSSESPAPQPAASQPAASQPAPANPAAKSTAAKPSTDIANGAPDAPSPAAPAAVRGTPGTRRAAKPTTAVADAQRSPAAPVPAAMPADAPAAPPAAPPADSVDVSQRGSKGELTFQREVYAYDAGGRRDPFISLLANGELRPYDISALRIATILHDPTGRNSIAILRDLETKEQYRVRVGQTLGRMRVTSIEPKRVTFVIDEFGFSRQEVLTLGESTPARTP